jgi:hypothetical protein
MIRAPSVMSFTLYYPCLDELIRTQCLLSGIARAHTYVHHYQHPGTRSLERRGKVRG